MLLFENARLHSLEPDKTPLALGLADSAARMTGRMLRSWWFKSKQGWAEVLLSILSECRCSVIVRRHHLLYIPLAQKSRKRGDKTYIEKELSSLRTCGILRGRRLFFSALRIGSAEEGKTKVASKTICRFSPWLNVVNLI